MKKSSFRLIAAAVLLAAAKPVEAEEPAIQVLVYDESGAPPSVVIDAMAGARQIFRAAGVKTTWAISRWGAPHGAGALVIQILKGRSPRPKDSDAFGTAVVPPNGEPTFLANVFYGSIEAAARDRTQISALLAHVLAHEVGHLLLGRDHTPGSIMCENFGREELVLIQAYRLRFSPRDADRIRAAAAARANM